MFTTQNDRDPIGVLVKKLLATDDLATASTAAYLPVAILKHQE
jgi:hypothetical protein